jgi:hypothetical protein
MKLPGCGLFRTTRPLPGAEERVPAGLLVNFHNHSAQGMPVVLVPESNSANAWTFAEEPEFVRQLSWIESLVRRPLEGFYALGEQVKFEGGAWPRGTLVQLGYDRAASPIVFIAQRLAAESGSALRFAEQGLMIGEEVLAAMIPLTVYEERAVGENG